VPGRGDGYDSTGHYGGLPAAAGGGIHAPDKKSCRICRRKDCQADHVADQD